MNKEEIYDSQINPLMDQIVAICKKHGIATFCTFAIPIPNDEGLRCTTNLPNGDGVFDDGCSRAYREVMLGQVGAEPMMLTTEHADGSKTLTAIIG